MARPSKIWFRKDTGWWMVTLAEKKIRLTEGRSSRKLAEQKFLEHIDYPSIAKTSSTSDVLSSPI
jgi:hypothetical protein